MERRFKQWLIGEGYAEYGAARNYSIAINRISEHYSENTGERTNLFLVNDLDRVKEITLDYRQHGKFSDFGYERHSLYRAAMNQYLNFFISQSGSSNLCANSEDEVSEDVSSMEHKFTYEKDLQSALSLQVSEVFPGYRIWGGNREGIEYAIGGRRIDILLEENNSGDLLVVELKSGVADYKAFGQISMYISLLQSEFPDRSISGVIVASTVDESLTQACQITDKIKLKTYSLRIQLHNIA